MNFSTVSPLLLKNEESFDLGFDNVTFLKDDDLWNNFDQLECKGVTFKMLSSGGCSKIFWRDKMKSAIKVMPVDSGALNGEIQARKLLGVHPRICTWKEVASSRGTFTNNKLVLVPSNPASANVTVGIMDKMTQEYDATGCYSPYEIKGVIFQLIHALSFMKGKGLYHGDVKAENVLIDRFDKDGSPLVRLADFGFSKPFDQNLRKMKTCPYYNCNMNPTFYFDEAVALNAINREPDEDFREFIQQRVYRMRKDDDFHALGWILFSLIYGVNPRVPTPGNSQSENEYESEIEYIFKYCKDPVSLWNNNMAQIISKLGRKVSAQQTKRPLTSLYRWNQWKLNQKNPQLLDLLCSLLKIQTDIPPYELLTHPAFYECYNNRSRIVLDIQPKEFKLMSPEVSNKIKRLLRLAA